MTTGTVKWFDPIRAYGFVVDEEGEDRFMHISGWTATVRPEEGMRVEFDLEQGRKGLEARNVKIVSESEPAA